MSSPMLPPYLGSYEELVTALLHDPFLGNGRPRPLALTATSSTEAELNPQPLPPGRSHPNAAVRYLATLISVKEVGRTLGDSPLGQQMVASSESAFQAFLDDFCGTPPHKIPWPWPGPPPWVSLLASEVASVANTQAGAMREGLLQFAGHIAEKGVGAVAPLQAKTANAG